MPFYCSKLVQNIKCGETISIGFKAKDEFGNDKMTGGDQFVAVSGMLTH